MRNPALGVIACVLLAACGDEDGLGGVEQDRSLGSLAAKEWQQVCEDVHALVSDRLEDEALQRGVCLASVRFDAFARFDSTPATLAASCEVHVERCEAGKLKSTNVFGRCGAMPTKGCAATNAELDRCVRAQLDALSGFGDDVECSDVAENDGALPWEDDVKDLCEELVRCQGLFAGVEPPKLGPAVDGGVDEKSWEEAIREHVAGLMAARCSAAPVASEQLDQFADGLARDWDATVKIPRVNAEWKLMRASELQYVLDTIGRFFDQSDAGVCVGRSYGLAVVPEGIDASVALLIANCEVCNDGSCVAACE